MNLLTKSKYLYGLQCPKLLWVAFNGKLPEAGKATQHVFEEGHKVGELAKSLYPGGIDISAEDFLANIRETKELLKSRKPLFEAGLKPGDIFARADILLPAGEHEWDIIEVKSSTEVKDINLHDLSFQKYCYEQDGLKIRKCHLMHINNKYVRSGEIDPSGLFISEDVTEEVEKLIGGVKERVEGMFKTILLKKCPESRIGPHCSDPYDCALTEDCWSHLPDNNVFDLYRGGKKCFELYEEGILSLRDIPDGFPLNAKQEIQKDCEASGKPYINKEGIKDFLATLQYPLHYLDFETFSTAIPLFNGTRSYQHIPFQFSLHVVEEGASKPVHISFLADGKGDPRKEFLSRLKAALQDKGSIIAFNQSFEIGRLKELGEAFPEEKKWVEAVIDRIVDLLQPFRDFHYYSPKQRGSASIKRVLPALTGEGYDNMEIGGGEDASLAFLDLMFAGLGKDEMARVREDLEKYCGLDTEGMVLIVEELRKMVGS